MRGTELLTDASVTAAFLDGEGRPRRQPKEWVEKFKAIIVAGAMNDIADFCLLIAALLARRGARRRPGRQPAATVIAIPPMTTPDTGAKGNEIARASRWQATQLIATDLRQTAELMPLPPNQKDYYSYPEVTAPTFSKWRVGGRQGAGHRLRPVAVRRPADVRLLRL